MRSAVLALASAALLSSTSLGFKQTSPLLVWSSEPWVERVLSLRNRLRGSNAALTDAAEEINSGVIGADEVYGTVHGLGCDWETLMVVNVEGLHNSHLAFRSLPYAQKADLSIPYLLRPTKESLDNAVNAWAQLCGAEVVSDVSNDNSGKTVVLLDVSKEHDLSTIPVPNSSYMMLLTGTHPIDKRQERPFPLRPTSSSSSASRPSSSSSDRSNSTIPTGGPLLERVQILTTPIITGVLITFLIFLPIIGFGIWSLAGIQVPPRMMEISKGMIVSKDKKDK